MPDHSSRGLSPSASKAAVWVSRVLMSDPISSARPLRVAGLLFGSMFCVLLGLVLPPGLYSALVVVFAFGVIPSTRHWLRLVLSRLLSRSWDSLSVPRRSFVFFVLVFMERASLAHSLPPLARVHSAIDMPAPLLGFLESLRSERYSSVRSFDSVDLEDAAAFSHTASGLLYSPSALPVLEACLSLPARPATSDDTLRLWCWGVEALPLGQAPLLASAMASSWSGSFEELLDAAHTLAL